MPRRAGRAATVASAHLPAPVGGLNTIDAGSAMPKSDALVLWNLIAAEYGLRSRLGYREWCTGLTGSADNTVRTILPFQGSAKSGSNDRLFAATDTGIWDVSASSSSPSQVVAWGTVNQDSGWCISTVFVGVDGHHYLLVTDEANGYYVYSEQTTTWTQVTMGGGATQIGGADPTAFVHVVAFKNRVWFVQRDTARAWYTGIGALYGAVTEFDFGGQFRQGGPLAGLWNWSIDGGAGIDASLVGVSMGGDVVIYQGSDPSSVTTFGLRGVWSLGGVPYGRRIATDFGGDLLLLSTMGVIPLSKLVVGNPVIDRSQYATGKIANLFNMLMLPARTSKGWSLTLHPEDNALLLMVPQQPGQATQQLVMSMANRSWSRYRDLPIYSTGVWGGHLYFGTHDGRVCWNTDYVDGVLLSNPNSYSPVQFSLLSAYDNLGNGRQKRVQLIRPTVLSQSKSPSYQVAAKFRWDLSELGNVAVAAGADSSSWDSAIWDTAVWSGDYQASQAFSGAAGMGVDVAIAMRGAAQSRTVIVGWDIAFQQGGLL